MRRSALLVAPLALLVACATVPRPALAPAAALDDAALAAAVEAFYRAETPAALLAAVAAAERAGPDTARFHEIAASLASLEGRDADATQHLLAAVRDTADDAALLHLHQIVALDPTWAELPRITATLRELHERHPDPLVRAAAASLLVAPLTADGALAERDARVHSIPGQVPLAWVGTWDNDQGKGFDLKLGPEERPGLDQTYAGRVGPLTWRTDVPLDPRGRYDLLQLMTPTRWSAAFGQGTLEAPADGPFLLLLTSTDPLRVWVDGKEVFADAQLSRSSVDHLALPLTLTRGRHTLLLKSAHREGSWAVQARLVPLEGEAPAARTVDALLAWRVRHLAPGSARQLSQRTTWAHLSAGGTVTVKQAEAFSAAFPKAVCARLWQVDALWFNQERGRTADLLAALDADVGDALPFVRVRRARFTAQQGLKLKAREALVQLTRDRPAVRDAWDELASLWRSEGWTEDELRALDEADARFGATPDTALTRARALLRLGRRDAALAQVDAVLSRQPGHPEALRLLTEQQLAAGELARSAALLQRRLDTWPVDFSAWMSLADARRRQGDRPAAEAALARAAALSPEAALPFSRRGDLAYQAGDAAAAVAAWRRAVELHPEDEALANRVDFLSPEARGPWMADVPDEARLAELVRSRSGLVQQKGADYAYLLDHEVTLLNSDGSTSNVVTMVAHAFNAQGRDRIIRQSVGQGRLRVLHAYAVDEKGQRLEASSERNRSIFFRGMQPGSTLVLQYRRDVPPQGYLSRYWTTSWSFQGLSQQRQESTLILWAPLTTKLHERRVGELSRTEERRGDLLRIVWQAKDTAPLVAEPNMPTVSELETNVRLSTVPDWTTWLSWEQALLEGVFRDSPELDAVAKRLGDGAGSTDEKLKRVHAFVMEEIRYQQDYESFIAGVKPHPAPMVLERRYGDCKDKAVLFIELAKKLGVEAHFALVRTRDAGPVERDVPMQQFNHAIVYVPQQDGLADGRFFDPTAELLDLDAVRSDDVGTRSLVFDPKTNAHTWRDIPYQGPEANGEQTQLALALDASGGATGTLTLQAVGRNGSGVRRTARNAEVFAQVAQRIASQLLPNATASAAKAVEVEDLRAPAVVTMNVATSALARAEGETLRLKLPSDVNPRAAFSLAQRRHPLVLGTPQQSVMQVELKLPDGATVKKLPADGTVALPCLSLARSTKAAGAVVTSTQTYRTTCERLSASEYLTYRARLDEMVRLLDDELVLGLGKAARKAPTAEAKR
jgi:tetratricopeptide (TPR) repeat protein/transglutaminase-like putative cysteine protease